MKTGIFTPTYYLVKKDQILRLNPKTTIGRNKGDIILEDDGLLSSIHCEIHSKMLDIYIKDLNSTNGIFVNGQKIEPGIDIKINVGDTLKIGSDDYIVYDNYEEAKKTQPRVERRRHQRPKNLYAIDNLYTFYHAPKLFQGIYYLTILLALVSIYLNIKIDTPVPPHLEFLSKIYSEQVIHGGIKLIVSVLLVSLFHSFLLTIYFNRNPIREGISLVLYFAILFKFANFVHGPMGEIKQYIVKRESIENLEAGKGITQLKKILEHKEALTHAYNSTMKQVYIDDQKVLEKDHQALISKIDLQIGKLKK